MRDKVVIITGASSGIGEACVWSFAKAGYHVVLAARQIRKIEQIAKEVVTFGVQSYPIQTDVTNEEQCRVLIEKTVAHFGRIDVLVNNAGISMRALFDSVDLQVLKKLMDVNFWGTVYCTKYALPHLLDQKGSLIGVSSIAGKQGLPGRTGYSASKFAMEGFLQSVRIENLKRDLHVLVACPGFTTSNIRSAALISDGSTQQQSPRDEGKMMSAEEVANRIVDGVKKRRRDLVLTRNGKLTVLLGKWIPGKVDQLVYNHFTKENDAPVS